MALVQSFVYRDASGIPLARIDRIEPGWHGRSKEFLPYLYDSESESFSETPGLFGQQLPIYHLDEVRTAIDNEHFIFFTEGEGKGDQLGTALRKTKSMAAVTTINGGAAAPLREHHINAFEDATRLIFLADSDSPGRDAAKKRSLKVADAYPDCDVRFVDLFPERDDGSDMADWLAAGHTLRELRELVDAAPRVTPTPISETTEGAKPTRDDDTFRPFLNLRSWNDTPLEKIEWLILDRIPMAEVTIIEGDGGLGKTTIALDWVSRFSNGDKMPDGTEVRGGRTLLIAEEDRASILKARLMATGANFASIDHVTSVGANEHYFTLPTDSAALFEQVKKDRYSLVVIDALFNHFDDDINSNRAQDVRRALRPLIDTAHVTGAAIIAIRHWTKTSGLAANRGMGSVDIRNIARSVVCVAPHPSDEEREKGRFVAAVSKSNLGRPCLALSYSLVSKVVTENGVSMSVARVEWGEDVQISANELAAQVTENPESRAKIDAALDLIRDLLAEGTKPSEEVYAAGDAAGFSRSTMHRASKKGNVRVDQGGFPRRTQWSLPETSVASQSRQLLHIIDGGATDVTEMEAEGIQYKDGGVEL